MPNLAEICTIDRSQPTYSRRDQRGNVEFPPSDRSRAAGLVLLGDAEAIFERIGLRKTGPRQRQFLERARGRTVLYAGGVCRVLRADENLVRLGHLAGITPVVAAGH